MIEIKRWDNEEVIHSGDFADLKECLEDGLKQGVNFYRAKLNDAKLNDAELNGAELNGAELNGAELNDAKLNDAELNGAELNGAELPLLSACICSGEDYWLFISPDVVQAGCQSHSPAEWRKFSKKAIADMDGRKSLKYYPRLLSLIDFFLGEGEKPEWLKNDC